MAGCCDPLGCDAVFGPRFARGTARRYRRHGLDRSARDMVGWLVGQGIDGATVLEIGGGIGGPHLELLRRGASRATNIELVDSYEEESARILREAGLTDRVDRRVGNLVVDPAAAERADVVLLHRVVCCYPDVVGLVSAAAEHADRHVVLTHPPAHAVVRAFVSTQRWVCRTLGYRYQAYAHPPLLILDTLREHGFEAHHLRRRGVWQVVVATRHPGAAAA